MRRCAIRICVFLLLLGGGAIVSLAVAWGIAIFDDLDERAEAVSLSNDSMRSIVADRYGNDVANTFDSFVGGVQTQGCRFRLGVVATHGDDELYIEVSGYGFPLHGSASELRGKYESMNATDWHWSLPMPAAVVRWHYNYPRYLPLRPLWPGFAINTVFYGVILWLLFAGPFVLRRRRRIRRGLCPKCAYDLRGVKDADACPECGNQANIRGVEFM